LETLFGGMSTFLRNLDGSQEFGVLYRGQKVKPTASKMVSVSVTL